MDISIILVDDHSIVRASLRAQLEKQPGLTVVGEVSNGRLAVELLMKTSANVVIMDVGMAEMNGIEATRRIIAQSPNTKVLALSGLDKRFVTAMLRAGASGYVHKNCDFEEFLLAIRTVAEGKPYISPEIAGAVVEAALSGSSESETVGQSSLTSREREVLQLLAEGKTVKQIALQLHVGKSTVETHRRHIMEKLDLHNIAQLTRYAIREGITFL